MIKDPAIGREWSSLTLGPRDPRFKSQFSSSFHDHFLSIYYVPGTVNDIGSTYAFPAAVFFSVPVTLGGSRWSIIFAE